MICGDADLRYDGERKIPDGFSKREKEEIEETIKEFELQSAFIEKYGEGALKVIRRINEDRGFKKGKYLIEKYRIEEKDIGALKKLIEAYLEDDPERTAKPKVWLEGENLIIESSGFCPLIESARVMDIDLNHACPFSTRPYFLAMLRALNPDVKHKNTKV